MPSDKRQSLRRYLKYPAQIDLGDGTPPRPCTLADVSTLGARVLLVGAIDELPKQVTLLLGIELSPLRRCKVVWCEDNQVGLEFILAEKPAKTPSLRSRLRMPMRPVHEV